MARLWLGVPLAFFALTFCVCQGQTPVPDHLPELNYPPLARIVKAQGDVVVSFRQTAEGNTDDVKAISGPALLQRAAVENVKAWHFTTVVSPVGQEMKVTFHFELTPPGDGYDAEPETKVELDGAGNVRAVSVLTTGLERSHCPSSEGREVPPAVIAGDFVELERWNETVRVDADGSVTWKYAKTVRSGHIAKADAMSLLERFRSQDVWSLCGDYNQAGLMDGGSSSFKARVGGRERSVREYGDAAPSIFREVESSVDAAANSHQWRHGDPATESIVEITYEDLPKPGKTNLMDAAQRGDEAGVHAALAAGDKLTDVDASGWTPLMYAASSYGKSFVEEFVKAGANANARSKRGETALMASAGTGMADENLLDAGADVNAVNDVGMTALMLLVQRAKPDEIKTLLKAGADARKKDAAGRTALDYLNAANCGRPIVEEKDPQWATIGYSTCNALTRDDYLKSKQLLINAGAKTTRVFRPKG